MSSVMMPGSWLGGGEDAGGRFYSRCPVYGPADWCNAAAAATPSAHAFVVPAPYGGPVLLVGTNGLIRVHSASGLEIATWKWTSAKIIAVGWSAKEEAVFVVVDGTVLIYDMFGSMQAMVSMGREAKDLKVVEARVFVNAAAATTGAAILTSADRFFVVNNLSEPRVRRMTDDDDSRRHKGYVRLQPWEVVVHDRQAKILLGSETEAWLIGQQEASVLPVDTVPVPKENIQSIAVGLDGKHIAVLFQNRLLWLGELDDHRGGGGGGGGGGGVRKLCQAQLRSSPARLDWCGPDAVVAFSPDAMQCHIVDARSGKQVDDFLTDYVMSVAEADGVRLFTRAGQELIVPVSDVLRDIFAIGSMHPGAKLRLAAEEFFGRSHRADDYIKEVESALGGPGGAVDSCIRGAGCIFWDAQSQKKLMRAAQFGKSFLPPAAAASSSRAALKQDSFSRMAKTLRVLNAVRDFRVGIPLTLAQYDRLTPPVLVDRLIARRLFPLALHVANFLRMPPREGQNRVLGHWACYKVSCSGDDAEIARSIHARLGHRPQISYCDIAAKAAECGKRDLAARLVENEARVSKQVPLLMQLGQESAALNKALASGDKDLAFSVILQLKKKLVATDFYMLIRKFPLGKVLYEDYCAQHEHEDALADWFEQEDDFFSSAVHHFRLAWESSRRDSRLAQLNNVRTNFSKAKSETHVQAMNDCVRLLQIQANLDEKFPGHSFSGLTLHSTLAELLPLKEARSHAEKLAKDYGVSARRYTWLRINALAKQNDWPELKKVAKVKKLPVPMLGVVKAVHNQHGPVNEFLTDEFLTGDEKFSVLSEFGFYDEAAAVAFADKNLDQLNQLEIMCNGNDDVMKNVKNYKAKLAR